MELGLIEYRMIVENSPNMIWRAGTDGKCDYFNATWLRFTGKTHEQEYGDGWAEGVHPADLERCFRIYLESFAKRQAFSMDYRLKRYDGEYRWINDRGVPVHDSEGVFRGYIGSCVDITDRVEGELLKDMAQRDGLCGIYNRQFALQLMEEACLKACAKGESFSVIMIDVDDFKRVNDNLGHQSGDQVLRAVADVLKRNIRGFDIAGRYGGEEFVVGLPKTGLNEAMEVAERIRRVLAGEVISLQDGKEIQVTASFGVSTTMPCLGIEKCIDHADQAMYAAKRKGKNCVIAAENES